MQTKNRKSSPQQGNQRKLLRKTSPQQGNQRKALLDLAATRLVKNSFAVNCMYLENRPVDVTSHHDIEILFFEKKC